MFDVPADFLSAQKAQLQFGIVYGRFIGSFRARDLVAGFGEKIEGRLLQTTGG
jgi:hypothetical protein